MGWFWADASAPLPRNPDLPSASAPRNASPPPSACPMSNKRVNALNPNGSTSAPSRPSSCPVAHGHPAPTSPEPKSLLQQLNPLNFMYRDLPQTPAPNQGASLPTSREESTIPKGQGGNWEYPSPQQMYHALLRKGFHDTDVTAVEGMVTVHNFLNEGAWAEIIGWEARFQGGLKKGLQICSRGEDNAFQMVRRLRDGTETLPKLLRFEGNSEKMTPRAVMLQVMGWIYPSKFATEPPFDRHDWYVQRTHNGQTKEVRYVIDYYSGGTEANGEPIFYLDVRPAVTPTGSAERLIRWGSDVWWRATGGGIRERKQAEEKK